MFNTKTPAGPINYGQPKKMATSQAGPSGGSGMGMAMRNANQRPQTPAYGMSGPNQAYKTNMRGFDPAPEYQPGIGPYGINADWMTHPRPYFPPPNQGQGQDQSMFQQAQQEPMYMPSMNTMASPQSAGLKAPNAGGLTRGIGPSSPYQNQLTGVKFGG